MRSRWAMSKKLNQAITNLRRKHTETVIRLETVEETSDSAALCKRIKSLRVCVEVLLLVVSEDVGHHQQLSSKLKECFASVKICLCGTYASLREAMGESTEEAKKWTMRGNAADDFIFAVSMWEESRTSCSRPHFHHFFHPHSTTLPPAFCKSRCPAGHTFATQETSS